MFEALVSPEMAATLPAQTNCRELIVDDSSSRDSVATDEDTTRQDSFSLLNRVQYVHCFCDL